MHRGNFSSRVNAKRIIICVEEDIESVWELIITSFNFVEIATRDCQKGGARNPDRDRRLAYAYHNSGMAKLSCPYGLCRTVNQFTMGIKGYRATGGDGDGDGDGRRRRWGKKNEHE